MIVYSNAVTQVHKATLRNGNKSVVLKVQHKNIDYIMRQDLINLDRIVRFVRLIADHTILENLKACRV